MASIESQLVAFVDHLQLTAAAAPKAAAPEAAPEGRVADILDRLREMFQIENIDEQEAAAIIAKLRDAATAYASGNWVGGILATMAAMRLYRQAKRD